MSNNLTIPKTLSALVVLIGVVILLGMHRGVVATTSFALVGMIIFGVYHYIENRES